MNLLDAETTQSVWVPRIAAVECVIRCACVVYVSLASQSLFHIEFMPCIEYQLHQLSMRSRFQFFSFKLITIYYCSIVIVVDCILLFISELGGNRWMNGIALNELTEMKLFVLTSIHRIRIGFR